MRRLPLFLTSLISALLIVSCSKKTISPDAHTIFKTDGALIKYAAFSNDEIPRFTTVRALKSMPGSGTIEIVDVLPSGPEHLLVITRKDGLYSLSLNDDSCVRIDRGIPPEVIYPFKSPGVTKPVISHSISRDGRRIAVVVPCDVYLSDDGGGNFKRLPLAGVRKFTELISVALHPVDGRLVIVGTSSNGIYYSLDGGATARRIKAGVPGEPVRSPNFLEEIRSICFGDGNDTFFAGLGNGGGVYRGSLSKGTFERLDGPAGLFTYPDGDFLRVTALNYLAGFLFVDTNRPLRACLPAAGGSSQGAVNRYVREYGTGPERDVIAIHTAGTHLSFPRAYLPGRDFVPDRRALGKHALYVSYSFTQRDNYPRLLTLLKHLKLNAVIINLKDDYGSIRVPVSDPLVRRVPGSVSPYAGVRATIQRLKKDGIYVIARQVCFKDDKLYVYRDHKYAVKNLAGFPFHKGPEKWVDGFSEFVWDYNIAVARELEKSGADEIQFDYIRFPDIRGENDNRKFDFRKDHQIMREALVSFLKKARAAITVPLSVDLFGYNAIYQWGEWIGQDVSELSRYVDVISPMFYPSHYTGGYAAGYGPKRIYYTIYLSCKRSKELAGAAHLRPYIQAFYYKDNSDGYCVDYIGWELDGLKNSGTDDYIFWNDLSEYTILIRGLLKYRGMGEGPVPADIKASIPKKLPFDSMLEKKQDRGAR